MSKKPAARTRNERDNSPIGRCTFPSDLGWMYLAWSERAVLRLGFGYASEAAARAASDCEIKRQSDDELPEFVSRAIEKLQDCAAGRTVDWSGVPLALEHLTEFQRRVIQACRKIPAGKTRSYAELAAAAGSPLAARAVGNVMRSNRHPLIVPCHRVVGSDGCLRGFTSPQGPDMKRRLLEREAGRRSLV